MNEVVRKERNLMKRHLARYSQYIWTVDCLFYVCTSRDYIAPQTSCILQDRLGMRNDSFVMDLPLGCSGWAY